jgi:hypothetical protein
MNTTSCCCCSTEILHHTARLCSCPRTPSCLCAAGRCSTAPRSSSKRPACARRWPPRNANSPLELQSADLESPSDWLHCGQRAALVCSTGARSRGRIPSVCSHVAHAVPASPSPAQTSQQHAVIPTAQVCIPSAHCRRGGGCAHFETPDASAAFAVFPDRPSKCKAHLRDSVHSPCPVASDPARQCQCQSCSSIAGPVKKCIPFPYPPEPTYQSPRARLELLVTPRRASWVASADACSTRAVSHFACSLFANSIPISN